VTTSELFLGVIAAATLVMAVIQAGLVIWGIVLVRRVSAAVEKMEGAVEPVLSRLDAVANEALVSMAAARSQMDRLEQMTSGVVYRLDQTVRQAQSYLLAPARQGAALLAGARAAVLAFRRSPFSR
jgi:tetrahydromethanopterin S-methyltransferase subunit B